MGVTEAARPWLRHYPPHWETPPVNATMIDLLADTLARHADRVAIRYFDGEMRWREVDRESDALAVSLAARGVGAGARAILLVQNIPQFVIFTLAVWKLGAIPVPSNPAYREQELARLFADCQPSVVMAQRDQAGVAHAALDMTGHECPLIIADAADYQSRGDPLLPIGGDMPAGAVMFTALIEEGQGRRPPDISIDPRSTGLIMYTSGTTGTPRGAVLLHESLAFNARVLCHMTQLDERDCIFAAAPFFHITGLICHLASACVTGCSMALPYRLVADSSLALIREHRPTVTIAAITAFNALMNAPGATAADFASFRHVSTGGAPVAPALHDEILQRTGMEIHVGYGMTETASPAVFTPIGKGIPVHPEFGALSIGIPSPGTDVKIIDEAGREVPPGEAGEICMRGPQIMAGYWNKPVETAAVLSDGWLRSGDVGVMTADGWIFLVDRKKEMIVASGFKVWPREVEDALHLHPAVREAAVVGAPDPYRGETVLAYVSLKEGAQTDAAEIGAHCRRVLTGYKQPRRIEIIAELPKTVTGKIQRNVLRARAAEAVAGAVGGG